MTPKLDLRAPQPAPEGTADREMRRHPRLELPARCWIPDGDHTVYLRVHDISCGGLSVRAPVPFSAKGEVEFRLELPGGGRVRARGQVVWTRPEGSEISGPRMGARFLDFLEGEEELYKLFGKA